ncbi:GntR family transcriptional regulator [Ktedonospora formicarum]|uniref:GntR family transcriptional regulator n=1 Tax=Ktedonospora formicarum TaxID=2778364 RepID=A0A8J3I081_9CHLR|nr:GntR family transcriptional regulator [Ktedonospora formicarum]GHO46934.1 GntR family transcriptional regulator [Ktedonospora formicarum]
MKDSLEHYTLHQRIYFKIRELIESGDLLPGTQLDERTLASRLSVSRTPLREAIATLVEEGLVERRPYRGNFVKVFTAKQISDLYEVRKTLEGLATRLAISQLSDEDLAQLRQVLDEAQGALEREDIAGYSMADQRFHTLITHLSANQILIEMLDRLQRKIHIVRIRANRDPQVVKRTAFERPRILAALEARNAELAERLMVEHIEGVQRDVVAQIEATEATAGNSM